MYLFYADFMYLFVRCPCKGLSDEEKKKQEEPLG